MWPWSRLPVSGADAEVRCALALAADVAACCADVAGGVRGCSG